MAKRLWTTAALAVVVVMLVSACGSSSTSPSASARCRTERGRSRARPRPQRGRASRRSSADGKPRRPTVPAVPTGYTELDQALGADKPFNGKTVSIQTQWIGGEGTNFAAAVADFATATGIKIQIDSIGSSHETVLQDAHRGRTAAGPGDARPADAVLAYAADGKVMDIATIMDAPELRMSTRPPSASSPRASNIWGIPYKADVKSTIWYPIKAFAAKGYTVPKTWDELIALSDKIVADGSNPWCVSAGGPARNGLADHRLGRGSLPQDQGCESATTGSATRWRSPTRRSRMPSTSVGKIFFTAEICLRRQHGHRRHRPEDANGSDVQRRHG